MARATLCIDTDILIDFLRAHGEQARLFEAALERYPCAVTSITVYELGLGIERSARHADRRHLQRVLDVVEVVPFDLTAARVSAHVDASLHRDGIRLHFPDLFIAGICLARDLSLLTRNRTHFSRIPQLVLLDPDKLLSGTP